MSQPTRDEAREALTHTIREVDGVVHQSTHRGDQAVIYDIAQAYANGELVPLPKCQTCSGTGEQLGLTRFDCDNCGGTGRRPNYEAAIELGPYPEPIVRAIVDAALEDTPQ